MFLTTSLSSSKSCSILSIISLSSWKSTYVTLKVWHSQGRLGRGLFDTPRLYRPWESSWCCSHPLFLPLYKVGRHWSSMLKLTPIFETLEHKSNMEHVSGPGRGLWGLKRSPLSFNSPIVSTPGAEIAHQCVSENMFWGKRFDF